MLFIATLALLGQPIVDMCWHLRAKLEFDITHAVQLFLQWNITAEDIKFVST